MGIAFSFPRPSEILPGTWGAAAVVVRRALAAHTPGIVGRLGAVPEAVYSFSGFGLPSGGSSGSRGTPTAPDGRPPEILQPGGPAAGRQIHRAVRNSRPGLKTPGSTYTYKMKKGVKPPLATVLQCGTPDHGADVIRVGCARASPGATRRRIVPESTICPKSGA